jgi:hypothetical protein
MSQQVRWLAKMKRALFTLILISLCAVDSKAQVSDTVHLSKRIAPFIPQTFEVHTQVMGDLNLDGFPDIILVLRKPGEDSLHPGPLRPMILLIGQPNNSFKLAGRNDSVVYAHDMGGVSNDEPLEGITISKGSFMIEHYGGLGSGKWDRKITFNYSATEKFWYLFKDETNYTTLSFNDSTKQITPEVGGPQELKTIKDFGKVRFDKFSSY